MPDSCRPPEVTGLPAAELQRATLQALPAVLDPSQDGYHDTYSDPGQATPMWDLDNTPITVTPPHRSG